jgi:hypothetical protein
MFKLLMLAKQDLFTTGINSCGTCLTDAEKDYFHVNLKTNNINKTSSTDTFDI